MRVAYRRGPVTAFTHKWLPSVVYIGVPLASIFGIAYLFNVSDHSLLLGSFGTGLVWYTWGLAAGWDAWTRLGPPKWRIQWEYALSAALLMVGVGFLMAAWNTQRHVTDQPEWFIVYTWVRTAACAVAMFIWLTRRFGPDSSIEIDGKSGPLRTADPTP